MDPNGFWIAFTAVATLLAAVAAAWAAIETRRSAGESARAIRATLLTQLLTEYASEEVLSAMRELRHWQYLHPSDFADRYAQSLKNRNRRGFQLDNNRRKLSHYFHKVRALCEENLIEPRLIDNALGKGPAKFLLEILEPLEEALGRVVLNSEYSLRTFDYFRNRYNLHIGPPKPNV